MEKALQTDLHAKTIYLIRPADGNAPAAKRLVAAAAWGSIRDVIILPYGENNASKSGCDRFLGRPDTYKLAPFMDSELGRAYETLITLFCKRKPFNVLTAFSASSGRTKMEYLPKLPETLSRTSLQLSNSPILENNERISS
uniref:Uncharacterized protein n=1 Tax=Glossina austeni TaxID=7395 RepID=A0A1A9VWP7_GLOAU